MPNLQRGGPCLNFAHFTMQFCNPSDPKGGGMAQRPPPPKYAPASLSDPINKHDKAKRSSFKRMYGLFHRWAQVR